MQRVGVAIGEGARISSSSSSSFISSSFSSSVSSRLAFSTSSSSTCSQASPFLTATVTSQESRARCLARISKMKPLRPANGPVKQEAAVLVALVDLGGEAGILFNKRSTNLSSHRGQVSFPGGKVDDGDASIVDTALRESEEEIGLFRDQVEVWGWMPPISNNYKSTPVVGHIPSFSESSLRVNPEEVAEVFSIPLSVLCHPNNHGYTQFRVEGKPGYSLPVFRGGAHPVWGLTAIITLQFLRALLPGTAYQHRLIFF